MPRIQASRFASAALVLCGLAACSDGPNDPAQEEFTLEIQRGAVRFEEETIVPGETLDLTVRVLDANGDEQTATGAAWSSTDAGVASVSTVGKVTGVAQGTVQIVVKMGSSADTAVVNVAAPLGGTLACEAGVAPLAMSVGQVRYFAGAAAADLCLPSASASGAEYVLVPFNSSSTVGSGGRLTLRVTGSPATGASTSMAPAPAPASRTMAALTPTGPVLDEAFHRDHLERTHLALAPSVSLGPSGSPLLQTSALPAVGSTMRLNAQARPNRDACTQPDYRTGRVMVVSDRAIIVADTANPSGGFTEADYAEIGAAFDDVIWELDTSAFGAPSDIDENQRVIIFYTRAVNELTAAGSDSYIGGFFYNRDLFPTTGTNPCTGSNYAEMFYMLVPDPSGDVNGNVRQTSFVKQRTFSVLAHEFQHLINDSRRLYVNNASTWEESWMNEGLSHIAEELAFYETAGYGPRQNFGSGSVTETQRLMFNRYSSDNVERYRRYLVDPEAISLLGDYAELAGRGGAWAFLRYVADRDPASDEALWHNLVNSTRAGLPNLEAAIGASPRDWMHDWLVSMYADDAGIGAAAQHTQPSWDFRTLIPLINGNDFPLKLRQLSSAAPSVALDAASAAFFQVPVGAGSDRSVRVTVNDLPPPALLRLAVIRVR